MSKTPSLSVLFASLCLALGCATPPVPDPPDASVDLCKGDLLEPDIAYAGPLAGPGVDPATGRLEEPPAGGYVVSATFGHLLPDPMTFQRFGELMGPIQQQLAQQDGLLAVQIASSQQCGSGRTLAVWRDEASLYDFAASDAHLAAMRKVGTISEDFTVTHWVATSAAKADWHAAEEAIRVRLATSRR